MKIDGADITVGLPPEERFQGGQLRSFDDVVGGNVPMHVRTGFDAYAQYWILAHYLTYGRPDLAENLDRCLVLSDGMMEPLAAFRTAFGMTPQEMWTGGMKKYTSRMPQRRYTLKYPIVAEPFVAKLPDPAEVGSVMTALGDLARRWEQEPRRVPIRTAR